MPSTGTRNVRHILGLVAGDVDLGRKIKTARLDMGLTQAALARRIGLHDAQSVSNYERGVTDVPRDRLRRIAAETRKPLTYFIEELSEVRDPVSLLEELAKGIGELHRSIELSYALLADIRERVERLEGSTVKPSAQ